MKSNLNLNSLQLQGRESKAWSVLRSRAWSYLGNTCVLVGLSQMCNLYPSSFCSSLSFFCHVSRMRNSEVACLRGCRSAYEDRWVAVFLAPETSSGSGHTQHFGPCRMQSPFPMFYPKKKTVDSNVFSI